MTHIVASISILGIFVFEGNKSEATHLSFCFTLLLYLDSHVI